MNLTTEIKWRPTYSSRTCLYVVLKNGDEIVESCPHTHGSPEAARRCAAKMIAEAAA